MISKIAHVLSVAALFASATLCRAGDDVTIPHGQLRPPNAPLPAEEAARRMTVPSGFQVEVVAAEPNLVNPVAMTFDERGRIWVAESVEYPRHSAGAGRDRIKILEDTDGDGKADKFTIFAEGLNIPSGIAVGRGGVWVANSPDILLLKDLDGDDRADTREVVATGFGRFDTHELPNSLTWGPDGRLYGWNGVFNPARVVSNGKTYAFTCAIWSIDPKTREFKLHCEGTSNPWGIALNDEGSFFASACVIDHLWHLVETGVYVRQAGAYPPHAWPINSIVEHRHQQAAYCGIHYFDSNAYPPEYRDRLYMGNIHGNCINVDSLESRGSTFKGVAKPDFLRANDAWFMPVSQKTGPDGCLYILDWYDRYHCYQDAGRDPAGIDRLKGRLYRVRYGNTPRKTGFNLKASSTNDLIALLSDTNVYFRDEARRLLVERADASSIQPLERLVLDGSAVRKGRMQALWTLVGIGPIHEAFHLQLLKHPDAAFRAWGVRAAGEAGRVGDAVRLRCVVLANDESPAVRLQVAVASRKIEGVDPLPVLLEVAASSGRDPLIPHIAWQNLEPLLEMRGDEFISRVESVSIMKNRGLFAILPRAIERLLDRRAFDAVPLATLFRTLHDARDPEADDVLRAGFASMRGRILEGEFDDARRDSISAAFHDEIKQQLEHGLNRPVAIEAALLAAALRWPDGLAAAREIAADAKKPDDARIAALAALIAARDVEKVLDAARRALSEGSDKLRARVLGTLGRLDDARVAAFVLDVYPRLPDDLQPRAVELLTQRSAWSRTLLDAIRAQSVKSSALNVNQLRKLQGSKDAALAAAVKSLFGTVRETRDPAREQVVAGIRAMLGKTPGDAHAGRSVFAKLCAQCHKIYGEGQDVGPDVTTNGRSSLDQLLSNIFDPNLIIGTSYQATTVATRDGRVLNGLKVEDDARRIVLKTQGGKLETIARGDVEEVKAGSTSLMPEAIEKQLSSQEIADLIAFLSFDRPPGRPGAKRSPGFEILPNPRRAK